MLVLSYKPDQERVARLENELDIHLGKKPRNEYMCDHCYNRFVINESYHGSPSFVDCESCKGGRLVKEANERLLNVSK